MVQSKNECCSVENMYIFHFFFTRRLCCRSLGKTQKGPITTNRALSLVFASTDWFLLRIMGDFNVVVYGASDQKLLTTYKYVHTQWRIATIAHHSVGYNIPFSFVFLWTSVLSLHLRNFKIWRNICTKFKLKGIILTENVCERHPWSLK